MIGELSLLWKLFDEVFIPTAVINEILVEDNSKSYGKKELNSALINGNLKEYNVKDINLVNKLYGKLHRGELEVIVGGKELSVDYVVIDEITARNLANVFSLIPIGTIGILRLAKRFKHINELRKYLMLLRDYGFRISEEIVKDILQKENEL